MYIRKKKYSSDNIDIIVVEKTNGKIKELTTVGLAKSEDKVRGVVKQRNITYIPVVRYNEILTNIVASTPKAANGRGDNREYEVGRRGRSWERIDDHIEEETTSYKFKM